MLQVSENGEAQSKPKP